MGKEAHHFLERKGKKMMMDDVNCVALCNFVHGVFVGVEALYAFRDLQ